MQIDNGVVAGAIPGVVWVKSSASVGNGNCVEVAALTGGGVAMRNSRFPDGPALVFTAAEIESFLRGAKDAEFDHLTG
ncbi:DUF397 domain-containing protein [Streptomyces sp. NBC_01006]|uniref:DUF397 domain-containing protein n=1 Tax=Streptomyces sp. NBC_01006 TaxID=2903716 RepID=UPI00386FCA63|nr:DUF397 domain-containing protein [Streptomyces sp. NBC_01006]